MGSRFKKTVVSENVRKSLHGWQRRVKARHNGASFALLTAPSTSSLSSLDPLDEVERIDNVASTSKEGSYSMVVDTSTPLEPISLEQNSSFQPLPSNKKFQDPLRRDPTLDSSDSDDEENKK